MKPFAYTRAADVPQALTAVNAQPDAKFIAGGTNLLDLMKEGVTQPAQLVDISRLDLGQIAPTAGGGVTIGALARNSDTANHPLIRQNYPLLSQAILAGASPQIRNMATAGGNLLQRTRCPYFYDLALPCNKRVPGTGCGAREGYHRTHAILGASVQCVATHPSDMCIALAALEAKIRIRQPDGKEIVMPFNDFHRLPQSTPERDNNLPVGAMITALELPASPFAQHFYYLKLRDRSSYAFALVSVAAALELKGPTIKQARVALGGVAHKPWRSFAAEKALTGATVGPATFKRAAALAVQDAQPLPQNTFKVELSRRAIVRALTKAARRA